MNVFEICIIILMVLFALVVIICVAGSYIITWRYKRFYETTEEGKSFTALYIRKIAWAVNTIGS